MNSKTFVLSLSCLTLYQANVHFNRDLGAGLLQVFIADPSMSILGATFLNSVSKEVEKGDWKIKL